MPEDEFARAEILYAQGNYEEALSAWEEAERNRSGSLNNWYKKGVALRKLGRHKEAIIALEEALKQNPRDANAWRMHASALNQVGRSSLAVQSCKKPSPSTRTMPEPG